MFIYKFSYSLSFNGYTRIHVRENSGRLTELAYLPQKNSSSTRKRVRENGRDKKMEIKMGHRSGISVVKREKKIAIQRPKWWIDYFNLIFSPFCVRSFIATTVSSVSLSLSLILLLPIFLTLSVVAKEVYFAPEFKAFQRNERMKSLKRKGFIFSPPHQIQISE